MLIDHELVSVILDAKMENQQKSMTNSLRTMEMVAYFELVFAVFDARMENQKKLLMNSLELMEIVVVFLVSRKQEIEIDFGNRLLNR